MRGDDLGMKRCFYITISVLLLLFIGFFVLVVLTPDDTSGALWPDPVLGDATMPHFTAYGLNFRDYYQFIREPSLDILNQTENGTFIFSISESNPELIQFKNIAMTPAHISENREGVRLGKSFIVTEAEVRFIGNKAALQAYLLQHGVLDEIEYVAVLDARQVGFTPPLAVWIQAGGKNFFIKIEVRFDDPTDNTGTLVYHFYTHIDFYEWLQEHVRETSSWFDRLIWRVFG